MQKVEGSNPFIRSSESPAQAGFSVGQAVCDQPHVLGFGNGLETSVAAISTDSPPGT
jgi:hypothetical protein